MKTLQRPPFPASAVLFGLGLFLALSVLFQFVDWDQRLAAHYFAQGWPGNRWPWSLAYYRFGEAAMALAGALAALAFALSFFSAQWRSWRGPGLYFALLLLLGPGLLVNGLTKALAGRPRPLETLDLGGLWDFARPFHFGTPGQGQSFLSGHSAAAWYFFGCFWALRRRGLAWLSLLLTLVYGGLMAWARVSQGAHWLSDTLLCGAALFTLAAALSPLLHWQPSRRFWRQPGLKLALAAGTLAWLSLSHVRFEDRRYIPREAGTPAPSHGWRAQERGIEWPGAPEAAEIGADVALELSDLRVRFDQDASAPDVPLRADSVFQGQSILAGSQSLSVSAGVDAQGLPSLHFHERVSGLWLAARGRVELGLPRDLGIDARLHVPKGTLTIAPFPAGRRVLLSRLPEDSAPPAGFTPYSGTAWLREGQLPLIALDIQARSVRFE